MDDDLPEAGINATFMPPSSEDAGEANRANPKRRRSIEIASSMVQATVTYDEFDRLTLSENVRETLADPELATLVMYQLAVQGSSLAKTASALVLGDRWESLPLAERVVATRTTVSMVGRSLYLADGLEPPGQDCSPDDNGSVQSR